MEDPALLAIRDAIHGKRKQMAHMQEEVTALENAEMVLSGNTTPMVRVERRTKRSPEENDEVVLTAMRELHSPTKVRGIVIQTGDKVGPSTVSETLHRLEAAGKVKKTRAKHGKRYTGPWALVETRIRPGAGSTVDGR